MDYGDQDSQSFDGEVVTEMDRLDKVIGYLKSNTTAERSDGDQLIQLACNCIKYADFYTGRSSKNWTARELFDGVLTEDQIKEVFDSEV